jgi:3',5'-nucleoside bisphosphate phosphatase
MALISSSDGAVLKRDARIDLHLHSHVSDGHLAPAELVRTAAAAGLHVIALTDHDTAGGVAEARDAASALPGPGVRVIPGIEVSSRWEEHEFHVLGYWIDPSHTAILGHQEQALARRTRRMEKMVLRLQELGIPIRFEEVLEAAGPEAHALGRPHLARALFAAGHTRFHGEAFNLWIGDRGPAFIAEDFPTPQEAIERIHAAGGLAVWAHPPLDLFVEVLPRFRDWGLDGVECYRPNLTGAEVQLLEHTARGAGLLTTGGSDWHGPHRAGLGDFHLRAHDAAGLLAHGGLRVEG